MEGNVGGPGAAAGAAQFPTQPGEQQGAADWAVGS